MINPFIVRDIDSYEEAGLLYNLTKKDLFLLEKITAWGSPENAELGGEANLRREFQSIINQGFCLEWIFNYKVMGVEYLNECRYKEDINVQLETNSYQFILTEPLNQKREDRNIIGGLRFNGKNGKVIWAFYQGGDSREPRKKVWSWSVILPRKLSN